MNSSEREKKRRAYQIFEILKEREIDLIIFDISIMDFNNDELMKLLDKDENNFDFVFMFEGEDEKAVEIQKKYSKDIR